MNLKIGGLYITKSGYNQNVYLYLGDNKLMVVNKTVNQYKVQNHPENELWLSQHCELITDGT